MRKSQRVAWADGVTTAPESADYQEREHRWDGQTRIHQLEPVTIQGLQALTDNLLRERDELQRRQALLEHKLLAEQDRENLVPAVALKSSSSTARRGIHDLIPSSCAMSQVRRSATERTACAARAVSKFPELMLVAGSQIEFAEPRRVRMCRSRLKELDPSCTRLPDQPPFSATDVANTEAAEAGRIVSYPAIEKALAARGRRGEELVAASSACPLPGDACPTSSATPRKDRSGEDLDSKPSQIGDAASEAQRNPATCRPHLLACAAPSSCHASSTSCSSLCPLEDEHLLQEDVAPTAGQELELEEPQPESQDEERARLAACVILAAIRSG